jgi:Sigma-70 region 2
LPSPPENSPGQRAYLRQLAEIREDPQIKGIALVRTGDHELAADVLQEAFYAAAQQDHKKIKDPRRYFVRILINLIYRLHRLAPVPVDNIEEVAGACPGNASSQSPAESFDDQVCARLLAQTRLEAFTAQRDSLVGKTPKRSPDPCRYRAVILAFAKAVLAAGAVGDLNEADFNPALRAAYPEWFADEGCAAANLHQRFKRARDDMRELLDPFIGREDFYP